MFSNIYVYELWSILTACALNTRRIKLGLGATNPISRHPAITALAVSTLNEISNGRAVLGFAKGGYETSHPLGYTLERSIKVHVEATEIIRRLLSGGKVTYEGRYFRVRDAEVKRNEI